MEQDVDNSYRTVCSTCLSSDRNLFLINGVPHIYQVFRLLMYDFAGDRFGEAGDMEQYVCWECLAMLKRFLRFKQQVHSAQDHLRVLALPAQESIDHTYISQSLSCLETSSKVDYDKIFFDYTASEQTEWPQEYTAMTSSETVKNEQYDVVQAVIRDNINLGIEDSLTQVPEIVWDNEVVSHIVMAPSETYILSDVFTHVVKGEKDSTVQTTEIKKEQSPKTQVNKDKQEINLAYITEYMPESEMLACREEAKQKVQYASAVYKCELCIIGFYTQQQVEDHFLAAHRAKPGYTACKVCYVYIDESKLEQHVNNHYLRYTCKLCGHNEFSTKLISLHVKSHMTRAMPKTAIRVTDTSAQNTTKTTRKKKDTADAPKPGELRKLLSKTTIEGYQCLECDMFFKNSRARKNHVARFHREGLQCDICKKRFVNRTTLATHLRLHEGPLPRKECPICHKMVRVIQLKYHIKRHESKETHVCTDCNKVFSHLATYQAHLKYSRAHASENVFKYPCPMCNKGYPTKEQMQDHFNYQHLGKTTHKCPVCGKPIASRANVDKHMMRVHGNKKEKPRNHRCQVCGKSFTDKKALTQHEVIHSGERPLACELCGQTFKQKASLYTHRKRVHKVFPPKRVVEFMDTKPDTT